MAAPGTPMLFAPPLPPVPLPLEGALVVGRSRSCDLTLASPDASRRHAEIVARAEGYLVRDLGSTNGTYLNGQRIREERLTSGDRIEIGGDLLTFCRVDPALDGLSIEGDEAQTRLAERPAAGGGCIDGQLAEIPPFALLQMLEMGRKTGLLEVEDDEGMARLWIDEGSPCHAETKSQCGFDAALAIVQSAKGRFSFEPNRAAPERSIVASVTELLLEASRQLDERA